MGEGTSTSWQRVSGDGGTPPPHPSALHKAVFEVPGSTLFSSAPAPCESTAKRPPSLVFTSLNCNIRCGGAGQAWLSGVPPCSVFKDSVWEPAGWVPWMVPMCSMARFQCWLKEVQTASGLGRSWSREGPCWLGPVWTS